MFAFLNKGGRGAREDPAVAFLLVQAVVTNQVNNGSSGQGKRLVLLSPGSGYEAPEMIHVTHSFSEVE